MNLISILDTIHNLKRSEIIYDYKIAFLLRTGYYPFAKRSLKKKIIDKIDYH